MYRSLTRLGCVFVISSMGYLVAETVEIVETIDPRYVAPVTQATPYGQPAQMVIPAPYVQQPPPYVPQAPYAPYAPPPVNAPPAVNYFKPQYNQFDPNYSAWQSYQLIMLPDQRMVDRVRSAISRDRYLAQLLPGIQIYASGGIITLAGAVPSTSVRTKIEMLAKQTNGVYRVDNQLVLIRPQRPYIVPQSTALPKR